MSKLQLAPTNKEGVTMEPDPFPQFWPQTDDVTPDLECSICFSQFNNVFRTPKKLHCQHTFCLECLARMNITSAQPDNIQCPLCRTMTVLPALGLPKLDNDPAVLSYLPQSKQHVYSIRFVRSKGRLQVKHPPETQALPQLCMVTESLDVGTPVPNESTETGQQGAINSISKNLACRVGIAVTVVLMLVMLTFIVIFNKKLL